MGKKTTTGNDLARSVLAGTFAGTGQSAAIGVWGLFNIALVGVGTVRLECSFDGGTTWYPVARDVTGALASWSVTATGMRFAAEEREEGVLYRLNCTAWTSTITYRISQ